MRNRNIIGLWACGLVCALLLLPGTAARAQVTTESIPQDDLPAGVTEGRRLVNPNLQVAAVLNRLDIDGDGLPDNASDTDGDGLPDSWEVGGFEALSTGGATVDRVVFFPSPSPIVPGTPPTPVFSRLAVATSAVNPDSDADGVSDFVEVFGLLFVDENQNGILDAGEWNDKNGDGMPSPGEWPLDNSDPQRSKLHDFDGFVFTDPTNDDTDGDGRSDLEDNDPLINPRAFGNTSATIVRFNLEGDEDLDNDGLGNGMDLGNDLVEGDGGTVTETFQYVDNPENILDLICLFRRDLFGAGVIPESQIEDLLGADWDANGLWRTTDVREWSIVIDPEDPATRPPDEFFMIDGNPLYATQTFEELAAVWNEDPAYQGYGGRGVGLGWHRLLEPAGPTEFLPDPRVWAVLYAWRMPGFDIDGDGFVGVPNVSSTMAAPDDGTAASAALQNGELVNTAPLTGQAANTSPFDDRIPIIETTTTDCDALLAGDTGQQQVGGGEPVLDGRIEAPDGFPTVPCGSVGLLPLLGTVLGIGRLRSRR